ncbi:unnamed protein product [Fusarium graminearum]|nr:unnamed protein product [Fusarium graminearum]
MMQTIDGTRVEATQVMKWINKWIQSLWVPFFFLPEWIPCRYACMGHGWRDREVWHMVNLQIDRQIDKKALDCATLQKTWLLFWRQSTVQIDQDYLHVRFDKGKLSCTAYDRRRNKDGCPLLQCTTPMSRLHDPI